MNELFGYTEISDILKPIWNEYWKKALGDEKQTNLADRMNQYLEANGEKTSKNTLRRYLREALEPKGGKEIIRIFNDSKYTPALVKELSVSPGLDCDSFGIDHPSNITGEAIKQFIDGIMKQRVELLQELYPSIPADFMVELKKSEQDSIDNYLGINHPSNAPSWLKSLIDKKSIKDEKWKISNQAFQKDLSDELIRKLKIFEEEIRKQNHRNIDAYNHVFQEIPELIGEIKSKEKELFLEGPGKDHIWKNLTQKGYILTENDEKKVTLKPWDYKQVHEYCTKLRPYLSDTQKERMDIFQKTRLQDNWGEEFELLKKPSDWILYIDHFLNQEVSEDQDSITRYSSALWAYLEHKSREYGVKDISKDAVVDWCKKTIHSSEIVRLTFTEERFRMKQTDLEETVLHSRSSLLAQVQTIFKAEKTLTKAQLKIERLLVTPAITQLFCDIGWLEYKNWNHEDVVELDTKIGYLCLPTLVENETILYASSLRRTIQLWCSSFSKAYIQLWCTKEKSYEILHSSLQQILDYDSLYLLYVVQNLRVYLHTHSPTPKQKQQVQSWFAFWLLYPSHIELSHIVSHSWIIMTRQDKFLLSQKLKHLSLKKDTSTQEEVDTWLSASDKTRITQLKEQYPKTKEHGFYSYDSNLIGSLIFQDFELQNLRHLTYSKQRLVIDHFVSMNNIDAKYLKCGLTIEYLQQEDLPYVTEVGKRIVQYYPHEFEPIIHDLIDNLDWVEDEQRKDSIKLSIIRRMTPTLFWKGEFPLPVVHTEQIHIYQKYKAFFDKIIRRSQKEYSIKYPWDAFYHFEIHRNKSDVKWLKNHLSVLNQFLLETEPHLYDWSSHERYQTNLSNDLDDSKTYIKRAIQCYTNTLDCLWACDEQEFVMHTISQKWHQTDSTRDKWIICSLAAKIEQYHFKRKDSKDSLDNMLYEEIIYRDSIEQLLDIEHQSEELHNNWNAEKDKLLSKSFVEQSRKWEANLQFLSTKKGVEQHPELVQKVYQLTASITEGLQNIIHPDNVPLPRKSYTEQEWANMLKDWVEHSLQKEDRKKYLFHYYLSFQPSQEYEYLLYTQMYNHFQNISWEQFQEMAFPITQSNRQAVFEYWIQRYEAFAGYKMIPEFKEEHQQRWLAYKKDPQGEKIRFEQSTIHENIKQRKTRLQESTPIENSKECRTRIWDLTKQYTNPYPEEIAQPIIDWFQQNNDWEQWKGYDLRDTIDTGIFDRNEELLKQLVLFLIHNHSPRAKFLLQYQQQYPGLINNHLHTIDLKWGNYDQYTNSCGHQLFVAWKKWATTTQREEVRKTFVNGELKNTGLGKFLQYSFVQSNYKEMSIQEWKRWHGSQEGNILSIFTIKDGFTPDELVQKFRTDPSPENEYKDFIRTLIKEFLEYNYFAYVDALHRILSSGENEEYTD